ncbi:ATP-binding protein [Methylobacterium sp. V23]|uniref:ATP-binding protein n=1 Tax=Methylobacterium sp. V23 TaxID=2044878 RepID=UPI000CDB0F62|nr:ATP-binding protein [Methylobacterium sp. V23]POR42178.1 hypothetical protein CRT23_14995 [Methylobacterium sp. V23]
MSDPNVSDDPAGRIRAAMTEEARLRSRLMEDVRHAYVRTARDTLLREHFECLVEDLVERRERDHPETSEQRAARLEGNIMVVTGDSGAGKSTAMRKLFSDSPYAPGYGIVGARCPVLTVRVPSPCSVGELGRSVLRATGYEIKRARLSGPEIWGIVRGRLQALGILVLHLDEGQDAPLTIDIVERVKLRNLWKSLLVDEIHPIGLIISGLPGIEDFLHPDRQLVRRGAWQSFARLDPAVDSHLVSASVKELADIAGLKTDEETVVAIVPRLLHAGSYMLGITIEEVHDAIRMALRKKHSTLTLDHFADAYAFRTGSFAPWNPYLAHEFTAIDVTRILATSEPLPPEPTPKKGKGKGKAGGA